jgi:hypothetical protein
MLNVVQQNLQGIHLAANQASGAWCRDKKGTDFLCCV